MRAAGRLAADVLEDAGTLVKVSFRIGFTLLSSECLPSCVDPGKRVY